MAVLVTAAAQTLIYGRGCGKTAATALTIWWRSKLALALVSETAMTAARLQQQWRLKLGLQDLASVASERRQIQQDKNNGSRTNLAWQILQGCSKATARRQQDGSDSNVTGANLDLWQRLRQYSSNGCDNTLAERTLLGGSVSNINGSR